MTPSKNHHSPSTIQTLCVYCSSSDHVDPIYFEAAHKLGREMAQRKYTLVYGGCKVGLMGKLAEAAHKNHGKVIGVIPKIIQDKGLSYSGADEIIVTENLRARKALMERRSDAFVALPGGFGTLEEILEIITLKQLKTHAKPILFLNINGFYNPLLALFESMCESKFAKPHQRALYHVANDVFDLFSYLENYHPLSIPNKWF